MTANQNKVLRKILLMQKYANLEKPRAKKIVIESAPLDTLAQLRNCNPTNLQKRAKNKALTSSFIVGLINLDSPLKKTYWNTYHCSSEIAQKDNFLSAKYCKNRACLVCNRIRTANYIIGYKAQLDSLTDPYFLTLTKPTIQGNELEPTIQGMIKTIRKIFDRLRKQKVKPNGIRKLECTYRPKGYFHPHFHLVVETKHHAELIRNEWLKEYPNAKLSANDIRPCTDNYVIELMKYFTKLLPNKKSKDQHINFKALDIIFQSMANKRVYQPFGKIRKLKENELSSTEYDITIPAKLTKHVWKQGLFDWVDIQTAEILSYYQPTDKDRELIKLLKNEKNVSIDKIKLV